MVSLGEKLKMPKTRQKLFHINITVLRSVQKAVRTNTKYSGNETILKIGHLPKPIAHAKSKAFAKWSVWVKHWKSQKHAKIHRRRTLDFFCAKSRSKKHQILEKWDDFAWAIGFVRWPIFKFVSFLEYLVLFRKVFFTEQL